MADGNGLLHQKVYDGLRSRIASGEWPPGTAIPSTPELMRQYGASKTPVRKAVEKLRDEGILAGHPGKAVYVKALPDEAAAELRDLAALARELDELRQYVHDMEGRIEGDLMDLFGKFGQERERRTGHG